MTAPAGSLVVALAQIYIRITLWVILGLFWYLTLYPGARSMRDRSVLSEALRRGVVWPKYLIP